MMSVNGMGSPPYGLNRTGRDARQLFNKISLVHPKASVGASNHTKILDERLVMDADTKFTFVQLPT